MLVAAHVELQAEMTGGGKGAKFTLKGLAPVLVLMYLEERGERSTWRYTVYGMVLLMMSIISEHTSIGENMVKIRLFPKFNSQAKEIPQIFWY